MGNQREDLNNNADPELAGAGESARVANKPNRDLEFADDRGGSRDGERLEAGDAGDRDQLDNDEGRTPSRR